MQLNFIQYRAAIELFKNFAFFTINIFTHYVDATNKLLNSSFIVSMTIMLLIAFFIFDFNYKFKSRDKEYRPASIIMSLLYWALIYKAFAYKF